MIIGASSYIGWYLSEALAQHGMVIGTYYHTPKLPQHPNIFPLALDVRDAGQVKAIIARYHPTDIVNLAGYTMPDCCEDHQAEAHALNVTGPNNIVTGSRQCAARIIHISTCYVFSGDKPPFSQCYSEDDLAEPVNVYGKTKLLGERAILEYPKGIVCRVSHVYGPRKAHHAPSIFTTAYDALRHNHHFDISSQNIITPIYLFDLINLLIEILGSNVQHGLFHVAGPEITTKLEFAQKMCDVWNFDRELIQLVNPTMKRAKRPLNSCLNTQRVRDTFPCTFRTITEALLEVRSNLLPSKYEEPPWVEKTD